MFYQQKKVKFMMFNKISLYCCNHTCYCVGVVSVTSASRNVKSASRYQSGSSMYIRGMIPSNSTELAEAVSTVRTAHIETV